MTDKPLMSGHELLEKFFDELATNPDVDEELRKSIKSLWKENKLSTKVFLQRTLDEILVKKSK